MDSLIKKEKIQRIQDRLNSYNIHIEFLTQAILDNPNGNHPEKPSRQSLLDDYIAKKKALELELDRLNKEMV